MKVATWNLNSAKGLAPARRDLFLQSMEKVNADVWVLTETWLSLPPGPDYRLVTCSVAAEDLGTSPDRRWVAIWSRRRARPLSVHGDPERMACARVEQPGLMDLVVVGTVLPWRRDPRHHPRTGQAEFCAVLATQAAEWDGLWGSPRSCALCVAGDFNQELEGRPYAGTHAGCEALDEVLDRLHLDCVTRHLPAQAGRGESAIDHLCIGPRELSLVTHAAQSISAPFIGATAVTDHDGASVDLLLPRMRPNPEALRHPPPDNS